MQHGQAYPVGTRNKKRKGIALARIISACAVGVIIFGAGIFVGQGKFSFGMGPTSPVSSGLPADLNYTSVEAVYDKLRVNYDGQMDQTKLMDGLKQGLAQATGDPYTEYFNATQAAEFQGELNGTFSGIGAELGKNDQGNIVVIAPLSGYPAEKAGIRPGDIIAFIDDTATSGVSVSDAVTKIRGPVGTKVTLKVVRGEQAFSYEITREEIKIASVESSILDGNIGYLKISRFGDDTVSLASEAATKFKAANIKGVILDLRSDPGGLLTASVNVSSLWLDNSQTVLLEKRDGKVTRTYKAVGTPTLKGIKTVVLIDGGSASASEITTGALKDNKVATVIGTKSYGKGSVQELDSLGDGSLLKVTIAHWFTPSGKGIDKIGIEPDKEVKISDEDIKAKQDPQKQAAIDFINQ